jgi:hypothetical protein
MNTEPASSFLPERKLRTRADVGRGSGFSISCRAVARASGRHCGRRPQDQSAVSRVRNNTDLPAAGGILPRWPATNGVHFWRRRLR